MQTTWFDENGTISEPTNIVPDSCDTNDPLLPVSDEIICFDNQTYVRLVKETNQVNAEGLPELLNYQIIYFNSDGTLYDSGILNASDTPVGEPTDWYFGNCQSIYKEIRFDLLCEKDDEKLLLIDSGGAFAEYGFTNNTLVDISTLSVPSAGSGADPDNFILYAVTQSGDLQVVDVNTKTTISTTPLFTNDGSPLTFSAAHFYDGILYGYDTGTNSLYAINVNTAEVSFVAGPYTNDGNSGTSLAINPVDGKFYFVSSGGVFRELDPTGANLVMSVAYDAQNNLSNGATFDVNGNAYITQGNSTAKISNFGTGNEIEEVIIDNWTPGANSITYYRTKAQSPSCFYRKFGILDDPLANPEYISDHFVADFSPRVISGSVDCCSSCTEGGGQGGDITVELEKDTLCDGRQGLIVEPICCETSLTPTRWARTYNNDNNILSSENIWQISGYDGLASAFGCVVGTKRQVFFRGSVYVDNLAYNWYVDGITIPTTENTLKYEVIGAMNQASHGTGTSFRLVSGFIEARTTDVNVAYVIQKGILDVNNEICWDNSYFIFRSDADLSISGDSISVDSSNPYDPLFLTQYNAGSTGAI